MGYMATAGSAELDVAVDSGIHARAMASLYIAGGTIGAISLLLPHPAGANELALWSNTALAFVGGTLVLVVGPRMPGWFFHAGLAIGSILVTRAVLASGETNSFY